MAKESQNPTEETPLLRDEADYEARTTNGHAVDPEHQRQDASQDENQEIVLAKEPDTKRLILIFFSVWISVFFAALGMRFCYRLMDIC